MRAIVKSVDGKILAIFEADASWPRAELVRFALDNVHAGWDDAGDRPAAFEVIVEEV